MSAWPDSLRERTSKKFEVCPEDVQGYLDVDFTAAVSREVGKLIFLPFLVQFLIIVSRNSYFDNWSWPGTLIFIFGCNMLLAGGAWAILRNAAKKGREEAQRKLEGSLAKVEYQIAEDSKQENKAKARRIGLLKLQTKINSERRGAYSPFFQDPALLAVLLPTGLFGVLSVVMAALFGKL